MIFREFIGWILSWIDVQKKGIEAAKEGNIPYSELQKKMHDLEKLIQHMSAENEEIKSAFFRNIYHEIRTPMNSILGFSSLLHNENLTADKRNIYSDRVWKSSVVFLQFIDDLVEASLLETQKTVLEPVCFSVNEMLLELYQTCNRHRHIVEKNSIVLLLNKSNFPENILAETDRKRLLQMLEYFVMNCMAGMEKGTIELGYKPTLNGGLSFIIKSTPHKKLEANEINETRRLGCSSGTDESQLRKRLIESLIALFEGESTTQVEKTGGCTIRIVINSICLCNHELIVKSKTDEKKIAI